MNDLTTRKIFKCKVCDEDKLAEHFADSINEAPARDLRLVCCRCAPSFNKLSLDIRREFLQKKINDYYGQRQYVYALCEPNTEAIRYVGRTAQPQKRFNGHIQSPRAYARAICFYSGVLKSECNCIQHKFHKGKVSSKIWIGQLMAKDLKPVMNILEEIEPGWLVVEKEIRHICQLVKEKHDLLNSENQTVKSRDLIQKQKFSFLDIAIRELEAIGFLREFRFSQGNHDSGWERALLLHQIFLSETDLIFDEHNYWDKKDK